MVTSKIPMTGLFRFVAVMIMSYVSQSLKAMKRL